MKLSKKISFLLLVSFTGSFSIAQLKKESVADKYRSIHWTVADGLSVDFGNVMLKDVKGFLWAGSVWGVLCRFDGASFKNYLPDQHKRGSINSGGILALTEDSLNNIWIGTGKGMSRYDIRADTFTNFVIGNDSINSNRSIIPFWSTRNHVYCLESGFRITEYSIHTFKPRILLTLTDSDLILRDFPGNVYTIIDTASNCLWTLAHDSNNPGAMGLLQISLIDGKREHYAWPCYRNYPNHSHSAEAMRLDRKRNAIWINSGDGLLEFSLNDKRFHQIDALNGFVRLKDYDRFVGIDIDRNGRIWFATHPKGILIYDPDTDRVRQLFSAPDLQQKVGDANLHIYCDGDGIVWTSYWLHRGIYELLPFNPSVKRYAANPTLQGSLSSESIYSIVPAYRGQLWMGTGNGLNIFDPETDKFEVLREKDLPGIKGNSIIPLLIDTIQQKAWLNAGPPNGYFGNKIYEMNIKTRKCRPIIFRAGSNHFDTLFILSSLTQPYKNGLLVCEGQYGFFEIKEGSLFADLVIPFKHGFTRMILEDDRFLFLKNSDGYGGLPPNFTFENKNGKWIRIPHLLDSLEWMAMLYNKKDQTHWVSFKGELVHYDKDFRQIKRYSYNQNDAYNKTIVNMETDNAGNLWFINGLKQIGRLNPATGILTTLGEADGYQEHNFDWFSPAAKDVRGNLYFGGIDLTIGGIDLIRGSGGLDRVNPEIYSSTNAAFAYVRSLAINQKPFPLSIGVNNLEELSLQHDQNTISIETGIIDYYSKGKGHIRYKLERNGKAEDWQYGPAYYTIRYDGLDPGNYKLVLQASNASNEFNGPEKIVMIAISPAFWNTWWFRITAAICLFALLYGLVRWRLHQKFRLKLERSEKEKQLADMRQKTSELEMQALRSQMNPHFIFNSLNSINRFILQNNRTQASEYLTKFSKLVRLILQNSQAALIPLESELESLQLYLELEALRFDHRFGYKISVPRDLDISALKVPPLIIQPYAENAIWHGLMHKEEKGQLDIEVSQESDQLFFKITDDGIGRKQSAALASKSATRHKSMGLKITAERIAMLQSTNGNESPVTINDLVNADGSAAGTEVIIKMPVIE